MNFFSHAPNTGIQYHPTGAEAKQAADKAIRTMLHNGVTAPDIMETITWGEVTERAASTGENSFSLKRQERLTYEAAHPQVVNGRMEDGSGNLLLLKNIHDADLLEHDLVLSIACIWEVLAGKLTRFKQYNFEDVTSFVDLIYDKYQAKRGGNEGNMSFSTIDRRWKLVIAIQKTINFGPEIMVAKQKMLEAIDEAVPEGAADFKAMVIATFTLVDGNLCVAKILGLRSVKINNPIWNEAMSIVNDAIEVISKKKQIRLYRRDEQGQYQAVPLNIAAL